MLPRAPKPPRRVIQFTKEGLEKIKQEYIDVQERRKSEVTNLATARAMGDLSENAAYTAARRKLSTTDSHIRRLAGIIRDAVIVDRAFTGAVDLGCTVQITDGTTERSFMIVGGYESDIMAGKLSQFSPIGKALMGRRAGDEVLVHAPAGKITYKIVTVEAA